MTDKRARPVKTSLIDERRTVARAKDDIIATLSEAVPDLITTINTLVIANTALFHEHERLIEALAFITDIASDDRYGFDKEEDMARYAREALDATR